MDVPPVESVFLKASKLSLPVLFWEAYRSYYQLSYTHELKYLERAL